MQQIITILSVAGIYSLLALGVVLVYRTSRVLNIAHGEFAILIGYLAAFMIAAGLPATAAVPIAVAAGAGLGWLVFVLFMKRIMAEPPYVGLMMTVGVGMVLHGIMIIFFGGRSMNVELGFPGKMELLGASVTRGEVAALVGSWATVLLLVLAYRFTRLGLQMRAIAEQVTLAAQRGININRVVGLAWLMAAVAAAIAGMLHGERSLLSLSATVLGINAVIAALIGGMDSLKGAILGSLIVAISEDVVLRVFEPRYATIAPALILLVVMVMRPWGLFGTAEDIKRV